VTYRSLTLRGLAPGRGDTQLEPQRCQRGAGTGPPHLHDGVPVRERARTAHHFHLLIHNAAAPVPPLLVARPDAEAAGQARDVEHGRRRGRATLAGREQEPRRRTDGPRPALRSRGHPRARSLLRELLLSVVADAAARTLMSPDGCTR
jgi:hypothetical protein